MDWQHAYAVHETPWDLRQVTPPLAALLASDRPAELGVPPEARVAVPGCGRGHDVRAWARAGYRVTGFDIAPAAVDEARALLAWNRVEGAEVLCRDVLGLGAEFSAAFDVVYDYTCLCALPPYLRAAYGREMAAILAPGGHWIGLVYPMVEHLAGTDGPPYLLRAGDLDRAFGADFEHRADFDAQHSVAWRRGGERWFVRRRR